MAGYNLKQIPNGDLPDYSNLINAFQSDSSLFDISKQLELRNLVLNVTPRLISLTQNIVEDFRQVSQSRNLPLSVEESEFDLNKDGVLDNEEKQEYEKSQLINTFTSSLDAIYFSKYGFTTADLIKFNDLPRKDKNKAIQTYVKNKVTGSSEYQNISSSVSLIERIIQSSISSGEELFKILKSNKLKTVRGKIYDSVTNTPIRGAKIKFMSSDGEDFDYYNDTSDRKGRFKIEVPKITDGILADNPPLPQTENPQLVTISGDIMIPENENPLGFVVYVSDEDGTPTTPLYQIFPKKKEITLIRTTVDNLGQTDSQVSSSRYIPGFSNFSVPQDFKYLTAQKIGTNFKQTLEGNTITYSFDFEYFKSVTNAVGVNPNQNQNKPSTILISANLPGILYSPVEISPYKGDGDIKRDLDIITLDPIKIDFQEILNASLAIKKEQVDRLNQNKKDLQYYAQEKLSQLEIQLKKTAIPFCLTLIASFGITKVNELISEGRENLMDELKTCPAQEEIAIIISKKNKIVRQLNNALTAIERTNNALSIAASVIDVLNASLLIVKNVPIPTSTGVPGVPGIPINVINKIQEIITKTEKVLTVLKGVNIGLIAILSVLRQTLATIVRYLNLLDNLIQSCYPEANQEQLSAELTALTIQQSPTSPVVTNVNGFEMSVETENSPNTLKRRRALARNKKGVVMLKGEWSFSSIDQILIDELVFYIQVNNLKAD
jgi:hypothetical protein